MVTAIYVCDDAMICLCMLTSGVLYPALLLRVLRVYIRLHVACRVTFFSGRAAL